ncbi:MAG: hypothetical protein DLM62_13470 [Pseudonocardiales bacterium]|nr:MAG: hypothetical protein DLM62_13470 [Pseudonocardiales bacterium]
MRAMEAVVAASDRDWTVFRPPRLTNTAATGRYRLAVDAPLPRARTVSRADLATAMVAAAQDPTLAGHGERRRLSNPIAAGSPRAARLQCQSFPCRAWL